MIGARSDAFVHPGRRRRSLRAALLATAGVGLVVGVWTGLVRAGFVLPVGGVIDPTTHGIVMVSGFFGALISLERAVALDRPWAYLAPPAAAFGALGLAAGIPGAAWWSLGAAVVMTTGSILLWRLRPTVFMAVMAAGAASWSMAGVFQVGGAGIDRQVPWLMLFLVGTIVGERLELSRLSPPSRWKTPVFVVAMMLVTGGGVAVSLGVSDGWRLFGAGLASIAIWLGLFDVARRTISMGGVTRFIAACLASGYVWLGVAGGWWAIGGEITGSSWWDGALHAVFVGFVFSMVFGHVHMVAPAVLGVQVPYRRWFVLHLVALHASLTLRIVGDLVADPALRRWGAIGNGMAIGMFLIATVVSIALGRSRFHGAAGGPEKNALDRAPAGRGPRRSTTTIGQS